MAGSDLIHRRAASTDAEPIADLVERAYAPYLARLTRRPTPMDDDYDAVIGAREVWVAEAGGLPRAVLVLDARPDALVVDNVAVDPSWQGRGVGRALLALAERRARELGRRAVRLHTNVVMVENQRLYEAVGYVETGRGHGQGHHRIHYEKVLD